MKIIPEPCPQCNSSQPFRPRIRPVSGKSWQEIYIACTVCNYEAVLERTNALIEQGKRRVFKLTAKMLRERGMHGHEAMTTSKSLNYARQQLAQLRVKLNEEIERDGSATY